MQLGRADCEFPNGSEFLETVRLLLFLEELAYPQTALARTSQPVAPLPCPQKLPSRPKNLAPPAQPHRDSELWPRLPQARDRKHVARYRGRAWKQGQKVAPARQRPK